MPLKSGVSEVSACLPSPYADEPSSPTPFPSSSQQLFLLTHSMPASVCQLLYCTTVLFKVLYCKIKKVFFIFCLLEFYVLFM